MCSIRTDLLKQENEKGDSLCTCQKLKFALLLLEYCKIRECYAVANAFTIRNMYCLLLYMKCSSRKINRPTKNMTKIVTLLHVSPLFLFPLNPGISWKWTEYLSVLCLKVSIYQFCRKQLTKLANLLLHSQCALSEPISSSRKMRKLTVCLLCYCSNIAKSENVMLWRMLSRLETCIVYCCIWTVTLAKSIVPEITLRLYIT
jgi:hypothetical protein